jgi:hypothetical protein
MTDTRYTDRLPGKDLHLTPPDYIIAGVCPSCRFEGMTKDFGWNPKAKQAERLLCPRCNTASIEIPYQGLVTVNGIVMTPGTYPEYECSNCSTKTKFGPMKVNGEVHTWCASCSVAVSGYHNDCLRTFVRPEFRTFRKILQEQADAAARRRMVFTGA